MIRKHWLGLTLILIFALAIAGCAAEPVVEEPVVEEPVVEEPVVEEPVVEEPEPVEETDQDFYFVVVPKLSHPWYDLVVDGMDAAIAELAEEGINVTYDWDSPGEPDVVMQIARIDSAIAKEPDMLLLSCLDVEANAPLIQESTDAGIPVLSFDTPCTGTAAIGFVGRYYYEEDGADLAEVLAEAIDYQGEVGILAGSPGALNHIQRVEGFKEAMEQYPDIVIVSEEFDNDEIERATNLTAAMLSANPDLRGVFAANAVAPIGAGRAIVEAGLKGETLLVGMDDMPDMVQFVCDGTALAMSIQNVFDIGYNLVYNAVAHMQGEEIPEIFDTGSSVLFAEDADELYGCP